MSALTREAAAALAEFLDEQRRRAHDWIPYTKHQYATKDQPGNAPSPELICWWYEGYEIAMRNAHARLTQEALALPRPDHGCYDGAGIAAPPVLQDAGAAV